MSLGNMRCDRCNEKVNSLFRLIHPCPDPDRPSWFCGDCIRAAGQPMDPEVERLRNILEGQ